MNILQLTALLWVLLCLGTGGASSSLEFCFWSQHRWGASCIFCLRLLPSTRLAVQVCDTDRACGARV